MTWLDIQNLMEYGSTVSETSASSDGVSLCNSDTKVFALEKYGNTLKKLNSAKVDALRVKCNSTGNPTCIEFIEFKGGKDPADWRDHKEDTLLKKVFDSIHCILHELIGDQDIWAEMFHHRCKLFYHLVLSDDNLAFESDEPLPLERLHNRDRHLKNSTAYISLNKQLRPYRNNRPFRDISIHKASDFEASFQ